MLNLSTAISSMIESRLLDLDICLPVQINRWNKSELTADVTPEFDVRFFDGETIQAPKILDVPILYPMTSDSAIIYPLKKGDKGVIIVSQRNLDNWKVNGARTPEDSTCFPIGSCFLIAGVTHKNMVANHLRAKEAMGVYGKKLFLGDANAIPNVNSTLSSRDVVESLIAICDNLLTATYPTATGPTGAMAPPASTIIEAIKGELEELKS